MASIKYYDLTRLKKFGFLEYSEGFMNRAGACQTVMEKMQRVYNPMKVAYDTMLDISLRVDKSDLTEPIHLLDAQQDGLYTALWHAVNSLRKSAGETGTKATSLWNTLNSKRVHTNIQYLQELAEVDRLIAVLDRDQAENIETLGLKPIYDQLKAINAEIHRLIDERNDEALEKPDGQFSVARADFTQKYDQFVHFVNAYQLVMVEDGEQPDEALDLFIRKANNLIKLYENTQHAGGGSASDSEEEEDIDADIDSDSDADADGEGDGTGSENTPSSPSSPNEPTNPGGSSSEQEYTVTYYNDNGEVITTQRYQVGQTIVPPTPPAGFEWGYLPTVMPARNLNIYPIDPETGA